MGPLGARPVPRHGVAWPASAPNNLVGGQQRGRIRPSPGSEPEIILADELDSPRSIRAHPSGDGALLPIKPPTSASTVIWQPLPQLDLARKILRPPLGRLAAGKVVFPTARRPCPHDHVGIG